jgi:phosphatidylglycerophosphatase A
MTVIVVAASVICIKFAPEAIAATGKSDPSEVVVDEVAGQSVTFLFVSTFTGFWELLSPTILGFLLFRLFDIIKPWPIKKFEKLPSGWGILADDLLAGVYAGLGLLLYTLYVYPHLPWSQEIR